MTCVNEASAQNLDVSSHKGPGHFWVICFHVESSVLRKKHKVKENVKTATSAGRNCLCVASLGSM